ncbi:aromatic hydrocarbon degradation protein [Paracoccus kondratievae]|uniref:Membrane protein n=1 Tax=Paracoccus kondratievae TaxID=135740 RepID=A0AAD3NVL9_9RHOB|nr:MULTISPECIES: outer membrane protein transport protein [Paracoccus]QFQ86364.1 aromatic hydrocarbon degradation protein [Paracoccus kondratievae]GLK62586.1 membrane protein [Paracoccus kondratievae]SMG12200.1 Long-chain fatty acid transport protein [Paracoccus sp. J56]
MNRIITGIGALLTTAAPVLAGGIERAPQSIAPLFEQGNYLELSFGGVTPEVSGRDMPVFGGRDTGDVAQGYGFVGFSYKHQFTDNLSGVFIVEQPFGADILYEPGKSIALGGTLAEVNSTTYTALLRYKFDNNFSVHGGLRGSRADGHVRLSGAAYGPLSGYDVDLDGAWGMGWVAGVAYEVPEIAARVSLTYNSPVEHEFDTVETHPLTGPVSSKTKVKTPRSWTLEGQTGIAEDTLLFGSIRWVNWSEFRVEPQVLVSAPPLGFGVEGGLVELEDTTTYTIGVGRKFTENWSGSLSFMYEPENSDLVSPLSPTNGRKGVSVAAIYTRDNLKVTTGVSYIKLGDAYAETGTPDQERAKMSGNHAWGAGIRIGYSF